MKWANLSESLCSYLQSYNELNQNELLLFLLSFMVTSLLISSSPQDDLRGWNFSSVFFYPSGLSRTSPILRSSALLHSIFFVNVLSSSAMSLLSLVACHCQFCSHDHTILSPLYLFNYTTTEKVWALKYKFWGIVLTVTLFLSSTEFSVVLIWVLR